MHKIRIRINTSTVQLRYIKYTLNNGTEGMF